jgi:uncharacterized protein
VAHSGHLDIVKLLLDSGAVADLRNHDNQTPLDVASTGGKSEITKYLTSHMGVADPLDGIDVIPVKNPDATLASPRIVKSTDIPGDHRNVSLLIASAEGNVEIVWSLLDQGTDVNQRNASHQTALHVASWKGKLEVARLLVEYGADVNCRDKFGWTRCYVHP